MSKMHPADAYDLATIRGAVYFSAFIQNGPHDRRREEYICDAAFVSVTERSELTLAQACYALARDKAKAWEAELGRPALVYAVNAAGRQALVTDAFAKMVGLVP